MREVIVDTETTGLDYKRGDRIIEVACVELINHVASGKNLQFYCSTDRIIDKEAGKIHGLSNSFLTKFPTFAKQAQSFLDFIEKDKLIIHNANFDLGFINNELNIIGIKPLQNEVIDTVLLARKKLNTRTVNLDYLCKKFSVDLSTRKFHGALLDCQLLSEVYLELLGGRQTSLQLSKHLNKKDDYEDKQTKQNKKVHKVKISIEEIKLHKEFVAKLKNSLWQKNNY